MILPHDGTEPSPAPPFGTAPTVSTATRRFLWIFSIVMVLTAGSAFGIKLVEFLLEFSGNVGRGAARSNVLFAIAPLLTYLIVAAGFACLFLWAYLTGQFRDVERPKFRMLEMQDAFDRAEAGLAASGRSAPDEVEHV